MVPAIVNRPATCRKKYAFGARWEQVEFFFQIRDGKKKPNKQWNVEWNKCIDILDERNFV